MSNSSLIEYTRLSPNKTSPRNHVIDTISIHCTAGGKTTAKQILDLSRFVNYDGTYGASCNYAIGYDGSIGLGVDEKDRSWCTSSSSNDHRAITIEVASDITKPHKVTDAAYRSLIALCVDICQRNGIKELKWKADKSLIGQVDKQNMTVHRWFANKSCPGDYLYGLHGQIAAEVNSILNPSKQSTATPKKSVDEIAKEVINGKWGTGTDRKNRLTKAGYDYSVVQKRVNELLNSNKKPSTTSKPVNNTPAKPVTTPKKSVDEIAKEVIAGKWGTGVDRKNRITKAGYDYAAVQKKVNELLNAKKTTNATPKKSVNEIAKEVIAGKWGSGTDRKNRITKAGYDYSAVQKRVNELLK